MDYAGFYINLDRSPERRAQIEAELARWNLARYARFAAADGNTLKVPERGLMPGHLGCWTSHYLLLKQNLGSARHLHVIEDDVIFASCTAQTIEWAMTSGQLDAYDILYTDVFVPLQSGMYRGYKQLYDKAVTRDASGRIANIAFDVIDLAGKSYASTSSFLVNRNSIARLHDMLGAELEAGPHLPIDLFIRKKNFEGALKVGCIFPFVTSVRLEQSLSSSIDARDDRQPELAADLARYAFFVGCDWEICEDYLKRYAPLPPPDDRLARLLGHLLAYSVNGNYRSF